MLKFRYSFIRAIVVPINIVGWYFNLLFVIENIDNINFERGLAIFGSDWRMSGLFSGAFGGFVLFMGLSNLREMYFLNIYNSFDMFY